MVLLGDGPLRPRLESMIWELGLAGRVHFPGFQDNPLPWMREATLLVLPSRHEGLGNVLIEALACGTQIVATDCPSGPAEILEDGQYGQLVPLITPQPWPRPCLAVSTAHSASPPKCSRPGPRISPLRRRRGSIWGWCKRGLRDEAQVKHPKGGSGFTKLNKRTDLTRQAGQA
nr:glycosyltransferase [Desulfonatronospira sp.]